MRTGKSRYSDLIFFILLPSITLSFSLYFIFFYKGEEKLSNRKQVATLESSDNEVKRKIEDDFRWEKIKKNTTLYSKDGIYTPKGSSARIRLNDSFLNLKENSLVILDDKFIELKKGSFVTEIDPRESLKIKIKEEITEIKATEKTKIELDLSSKETKIKVIEGEATVGEQSLTVADEKVELKQVIASEEAPKEEIIVPEVVAPPEEVEISLFTPKQEQKISYYKADFVEMIFGHKVFVNKTEVNSLENIESFLEISNNPSFENPSIVKIEKEKKFSTIDLPPGDYYWKLTTSYKEKHSRQESGKFSLEIYNYQTKIEQKVIEKSKGNFLAKFSWELLPLPLSKRPEYKIEIYDESNKVVFHQEYNKKNMEYSLSALEYGKYKWRVGHRFNSKDQWFYSSFNEIEKKAPEPERKIAAIEEPDPVKKEELLETILKKEEEPPRKKEKFLLAEFLYGATYSQLKQVNENVSGQGSTYALDKIQAGLYYIFTPWSVGVSYDQSTMEFSMNSSSSTSSEFNLNAKRKDLLLEIKYRSLLLGVNQQITPFIKNSSGTLSSLNLENLYAFVGLSFGNALKETKDLESFFSLELLGGPSLSTKSSGSEKISSPSSFGVMTKASYTSLIARLAYARLYYFFRGQLDYFSRNFTLNQEEFEGGSQKYSLETMSGSFSLGLAFQF